MLRHQVSVLRLMHVISIYLSVLRLMRVILIYLCFSDFAANDYINKRVLGSESKISIDNATYQKDIKQYC